MVEHRSNDDEKALADRLRQEAQETRPAFSESLHSRICRAVEHCEIHKRPRSAIELFRNRWVYMAVAATLLVGALFVARRLSLPGGSTPEKNNVAVEEKTEADPDTDAETPTDVPLDAVDIGMLVDSTFSRPRWAYLDHDAQLVARMLIDQLPLDMTSPIDEP